MRLRFTVLFIFCLVCLVQGQVQRLSLAQCVQIALANNPELNRSELQMARADIRYRQAHYNRLPSLNASADHSLNQGRNIDPTTNQFINSNITSGRQSLNANLPLFNGLQTLHDIRMKSNAREAGKLEYEGLVNELKLDVIESYIQVLTTQDMFKQTKGQLAVIKEQVHRASVLNKEGAIAPGDYYDLIGQQGNDEVALQTAEQNVLNSRLRLARLLNVSVETLADLEPLAPKPLQGEYDQQVLYGKSLEVLPQMKALQWRKKEATEAVKVARSGYFPSLSVNAGLDSRYSSNSTSSYWRQANENIGKGISLNLTVPIFNRMNLRSQIKLASLDVQEAEWNERVQQNILREETAKAVFSLKTSVASIRLLEEQTINFQEAFRIAQIHFEAGNSNSVLFLTAKNKLDYVQNQLLIKQYELIFQKFVNDYYAGALDL